jgi:hypothetical protein
MYNRTEKVLNDFVKKFDPELSVKITNRFYFNTTCNTIEITLEIGATEILFSEYFYEKHDTPEQFNELMTNFLHELGHSETFPESLIDKTAHDERRRFYLEFEYLLDEQKALAIYSLLFEEKTANFWAATYINDHAAEIHRLIDDLTAALEKDLEFTV